MIIRKMIMENLEVMVGVTTHFRKNLKMTNHQTLAFKLVMVGIRNHLFLFQASELVKVHATRAGLF